jgi:membrane protease YdiL (CAAX protease family)
MSVILTFIAMLMAMLVYGLMGLTPMIPKRVFLTVTFFYVAALLVVFPALIYCYDRMVQIDWILSFCQVILGLGLLWWLRGGLKFRWPIVEDKHLGDRGFSWLNLAIFLLVNVFGVLPAMVAYVAVCATLAVNHFSGGFLALHPGGMTVQVRKYVRNDGKTILLIPMAHVAEADFYRKVSQSFPSNSIILMEGVTDRQHLITTGTSYKRMARALHMAEQHEEFEPSRGEMVQADVDVEQFSTNTIGFLNLVMLVHSKGITPETVQEALQYSPPPDFQKQVFGDLLRKRNRHLWEEIQARLPQSDNIIVPWGVAHMPEIAAEIQKSGFRLDESQEYEVIRFHVFRKQSRGT